MPRTIGIGGGVAIAILLGAGCTSPPRVDLYIANTATAKCGLFDLDRSKEVEEVFVMPGDEVAISNTLAESVTLYFTKDVFEDTGVHADTSSVVLAPHSRLPLRVLSSADKRLGYLWTDCYEGGVSGPQIVVGDPP
ncbi:MAG: hypothetical protein R3B81_09090 [bacterium]